ncbi:response regulator [Sinomicrobium weinanense]|uniref:Response regulator transcription factor n=1 Tax=Sinomicrobium weinanense TaxID=2842200 RepID=A0A926JPD5_9FLAO|nr:response regulator transcription factor [Sinomicrobium weinanense]MBC9794832.1 response regulator transcription factor [Sinomicrobium weinanense]MBU3125603.1 response regulator transcription factor [Sinomicrobium weinanense]
MSKNYPILLVDDHIVIQFAIARIIEDFLPHAKITSIEDFSQTIDLLEKEYFELIILDIDIPNGIGTEMISVIRSVCPDVKILMFSALSEKRYAMRFIQAGANGYLHKHSSKEEIEEAITEVINGDTYISRTVTKHFLHESSLQHGMPLKNPLNSLSNRELEIARLMAKGNGNLEIVNILDLKKSTVSTHKMRIFKKLDISNVTELIEIFNHYDTPVFAF